MTSPELPILDLEAYRTGEPGALEVLAKKLAFVQENVGFYIVVNHGVSDNIVNRAYAELKRFFALPEADKLALKIDQSSVGYVPAKSTIYVTSVINENTKADLNETLITALERPADHPLIEAGTRFVGPNKWPDLPGFRETIVEYQHEMLRLGRLMLPLYARALDLPADYFELLFTDPVMWSRNSHYPAVEPEDNQFGISPHCDHSFISLLPIPGVPGLEIQTQEGTWFAAQPVEGGIIVNTGEFMNRWTNGRFVATPHRVVPPPQDRYSIATFFNPNHDTVAKIFETCTGPDNPPQFEPVRLIDYVAWYIDTNYKRDAGGHQA